MNNAIHPELDAVCAAVFARGRSSRTFPGGVVHCAGSGFGHLGAYEYATYDESEPAAVDMLYDAASLTKLFTATALLRAAHQSGVALETPLARFLPDFAAPPLDGITLLHLLQHNSGLALHVQELAAEPPAQWPRRIAEAGLMAPPGTSVRYTCTAFVLLGWVIEKLTGLGLEAAMQALMLEPLGLGRTCYNAARRFPLTEIAPTEIDASTGQPWRGVVHDEAARALDGIAGNAGLFSTAADLGVFARLWLNEGSHEGEQLLPAELVRRALQDTVPGDGYRQAVAWHLDVSSYMSPQAPRGTAGHLGFTGPMLWICPAKGVSLTVLNNRVFPTREGPQRLNLLRELSVAALGRG